MYYIHKRADVQCVHIHITCVSPPLPSGHSVYTYTSHVFPPPLRAQCTHHMCSPLPSHVFPPSPQGTVCTHTHHMCSPLPSGHSVHITCVPPYHHMCSPLPSHVFPPTITCVPPLPSGHCVYTYTSHVFPPPLRALCVHIHITCVPPLPSGHSVYTYTSHVFPLPLRAQCTHHMCSPLPSHVFPLFSPTITCFPPSPQGTVCIHTHHMCSPLPSGHSVHITCVPPYHHMCSPCSPLPSHVFPPPLRALCVHIHITCVPPPPPPPLRAQCVHIHITCVPPSPQGTVCTHTHHMCSPPSPQGTVCTHTHHMCSPPPLRAKWKPWQSNSSLQTWGFWSRILTSWSSSRRGISTRRQAWRRGSCTSSATPTSWD